MSGTAIFTKVMNRIVMNRIVMNKIAAVVLLSVLLGACSGSEEEHHHVTSDDSRQEMTGSEAGEFRATVPVSDEIAGAFDAVINDYLNLTGGLVESDPSKASDEAERLHESVDRLVQLDADPELQTRFETWTAVLLERSESMANASDVEEQRGDYEHLSETMITMVEVIGHGQGTLYHQRCPMVNGGNGDWLSAREQILNPYHGNRMLNCGSTVQVL